MKCITKWVGIDGDTITNYKIVSSWLVYIYLDLTFRYLLELQVPLGPLGTSWTSRYLLDLQVPLGIDRDSQYRHGLIVLTTLMVLTQTHCIVCYWREFMVQTWTHGNNKDSCYIHGLMVLTQTHHIELELLKYKRAECCPYVEFFMSKMS